MEITLTTEVAVYYSIELQSTALSVCYHTYTLCSLWRNNRQCNIVITMAEIDVILALEFLRRSR